MEKCKFVEKISEFVEDYSQINTESTFCMKTMKQLKLIRKLFWTFALICSIPKIAPMTEATIRNFLMQ